MNDPPSLPGIPASPAPQARPARSRAEAELDAAFEADLRLHPGVYAGLAYLAREARRRNVRHGIQTFWETYRFVMAHYGRPSFLRDELKGRYARRLMAREPDLDGYFQIRLAPRGRGEDE